MKQTDRQISERRMVIDFIGIGNGRSGSTWISRCLSQHPEISFSSEKSRKEIRFFCVAPNWNNYEKGLDWYLDQFPPYQKGKIRGEFTPEYLCDPESHLRIKKYFPNVKIIATLRKPSDFVYSWYHFEKLRIYGGGPGSNNFEDLFNRESAGSEILERGFYYKFLSKYYSVFPKENIHVVLFDDIKNQPLNVARQMYRFLGARDDFKPSILEERINKSKALKSQALHKAAHKTLKLTETYFKPLFEWLNGNSLVYRLYKNLNIREKDYAPMGPTLKLKLNEFYKKDICQLETLLDRDLSSWLE